MTRMQELEMRKAELEKELAMIKAEMQEIKASEKKAEETVEFDYDTFTKLLDRSTGTEMLNTYSTTELKQIAKKLSVRLNKSSKAGIIERIVEVVIGGAIRKHTLDSTIKNW